MVATLALGVPGAPALAADPAAVRREADERFYEGRALMEQGAVPEACAKFARSLELLRRGGTLLNLATCREKEGRPATAFVLFQDALATAAADGRTDRVETARAAIERLRARLSWLTVSPAREAAGLPGLAIARDGVPLERAAWGAVVPVDPGPHTITASATGRRRYEVTVAIGDNGDRRTVEIPMLPPAPGAPASEGTPPVPAAREPGQPWRKPVGIAALGVGAAALALGGAFGVKAIVDSRESERLCPEGRCATDQALAKGTIANSDARAAALAANVALPIGALLGAAGIFVLVTAPAPPRKGGGARVDIAPVVASGGLGLSVEGAW